MTRYIHDQNKVVLLHESGTYATTSGNGYWIGQVIEHEIEDNENKTIDVYMGTASRSFSTITPGPRDANGTLTYNMQDGRIPFFAIGSVNEGGGVNAYYHLANQINTATWLSPFVSGTGLLSTPISFTLEDSKQSPGTGRNFIRTIRGCIPNEVTITAAEGEKVKVECAYVAQNVAVTSGNTTTLVEITTTPYLWNNCTLTLGGSPINTAKEVSLVINNNIEAPHYVNGSRDVANPYPLDRELTLNVTLDLDGNDADMLYNEYYKSNGIFNATFDMNRDTTGSQHIIFALSGCRITTMENPSTIEGAVESTIEIRPQNIIGSAFDNVAKYNPW